ncbi:cytochrome c1 [Methylovirgula sp. HY1]|uniref:cytochrome c1 n=1 Tax=Methylovirgula sp. HY1 TaxID=2822761 RepID=UPI001C788AE9|nr:cytochrome c1 [Methylovirgula sp. HY1]QXX75585.1 Cytochrome b/c1 [Methylovirgula sp. HY1]
MVLRKTSGRIGLTLGALALGGIAFGGFSINLAKAATAQSGQAEPIPPRQHWSFAGPFGKFDRAQLQRGYKVYHDVCSNCHSMKLLSFRDLAAPGGPDFSEAQVKALAATYKVKDGPNDAGQMYERPGRPADTFPSPFANKEAAAAAFGTAPPDMSDLAKARSIPRPFPLFIFDAFTQYQEEGPDYIVGILNGYTHPNDPNWNEYFPGHKIAMPNPLSDGAVVYTDGSPQTVKQYSKDVAAFLFWAAEPKLDARKELGFRVMLFLIVFAVLMYFTKKKVWSNIPH